jgi:aryl-alcohol dehydrogenase-like predicted oxidoreductase
VSAPRRILGRTGIEVSACGLGTFELRGADYPEPRALSDGEQARLLGEALDLGVNLIDTAPDYGDAEEVIGRHLSHRRDELVLVSKCGCVVDDESTRDLPPGPRPHLYTRANILANVERSLGRLRTDHIDVLLMHHGPPATLIDEEDVLATFEMLRDQGKVRYCGSSSTLPNALEHVGMFGVLMLPYSALDVSHEQVLRDAADAGAGIIVRGAVARGAPDGADGSRGSWTKFDQTRMPTLWRRWSEAGLDGLLDGQPRESLLIRFVLSEPGIASAVIGTATPAHLRGNVKAAAQGPLPCGLLSEVRQRLAAASLAE